MKLTWKKLIALLSGLIIIGYFVSVWWSIEPPVLNPTTYTTASERKVVGYTTTSALIMTMDTLLNKSGGWLSNDVMPPSVFMDNMPAFEFGALEQARDLALVMRKEFSRSQSQSTADKDLLAAQSKLNIEHWEN